MSTGRATVVCVVLGAVAATACTLWLGACDRAASTSPRALEVWQTETDPDAIEVLRNLAKEYESETGLPVRIQSVPWGTLSSKLAAAIQARNEPDIAHLEPFMARSLFEKGLLVPIDSLIEQLEADNGVIMKGVRDLQQFDGKHYGIAYAVGTTGFAYRKDVVDRLGLSEPRDWQQYIDFVRQVAEDEPTGKRLCLLLPGGDAFFMDQLFAELVANNGGRLFDQDGNPVLNSQPVIETLYFLLKLKPYLDPEWQRQRYLDQFNRLARGEAGNVPVTYVRAIKALDDLGGAEAGPAKFGIMIPPRGPSLPDSTESVATIDCEPFVLFKRPTSQTVVVKGKSITRYELCCRFLRLFYERKWYLQFCEAVPIVTGQVRSGHGWAG
jgi:raffinose/stachyose/melibiose transport system substrate-binding protein